MEGWKATGLLRNCSAVISYSYVRVIHKFFFRACTGGERVGCSTLEFEATHNSCHRFTVALHTKHTLIIIVIIIIIITEKRECSTKLHITNELNARLHSCKNLQTHRHITYLCSWIKWNITGQQIKISKDELYTVCILDLRVKNNKDEMGGTRGNSESTQHFWFASPQGHSLEFICD